MNFTLQKSTAEEKILWDAIGGSEYSSAKSRKTRLKKNVEVGHSWLYCQLANSVYDIWAQTFGFEAYGRRHLGAKTFRREMFVLYYTK